MIFVDGNYADGDGENLVETLELTKLDWDDVNLCISELFKWEQENNIHIDFVEVWREDENDPIRHYTREEAIDLCNPTLKYCRSIWRSA